MSIIGRILSSSVAISDFRNPQNWLVNAFSGRTSAGELVTNERALGLSGFWHPTRSISEDVGKIPLVTFRRIQPKGKDPARDHPVFRLLHDEPNPNMTAQAFKETLTMHAITNGNGIAEIEFSNRTGDALALWPIHPTRVNIRKNRDPRMPRSFVYDIHNDDGTVTSLEPRRVFDLHGLGMDGVHGFSILRIAAQAIGIGLAVETFGATFFGNGTHLRGAVRHPGKLGDKAYNHLRESWAETYQGPENAHKFAILEEGMEWVRMGSEPEAAQFLQTREFTVEELARFFRMPAQKMGMVVFQGQGGQKMSDEDVQSLYVTDTLLPWLIRWEQEAARKLFSFEADAGFFAQYQISGLLRGSSESRADYLSKLFHIGMVSQNDGREQEGLNPIEDGDTYYVPVNVVPSDLASRGEVGGVPDRQPAGDQTQTDRARDDADREDDQGAPSRRQGGRSIDVSLDVFAPVVLDVFSRFMAKAENGLARAAKKHADDVNEFTQWVDHFAQGQLAMGVDLLEMPRIVIADATGFELEGESATLAKAITEFRAWAMELYRDDPLTVRDRWRALNDGRDELYTAEFLGELTNGGKVEA